jgi:hypothetical protein
MPSTCLQPGYASAKSGTTMPTSRVMRADACRLEQPYNAPEDVPELWRYRSNGYCKGELQKSVPRPKTAA